jgi:DNA polymerase-4
MAVTMDKRTLAINHKETGLPLSFALSVNKTVSKIGTGESKPLEIPETMVKFLNRCPSKIRWLVTSLFNCFRIGITIQTLSEMPAEVLQQMIGKKRYDI